MTSSKESEGLLLNDLEINDKVKFRNGGISTVTQITYEKVMDGYEIVELVFDGHFNDAWYYEMDGMMEPVGASSFDIVEVITVH